MSDKKLRVYRPLIFLCGPAYDDKNANDRRKILFEYIKTFKTTIKIGKRNSYFALIPVIVDKIFNNDSMINNLGLKLDVLEEIVAEISYKTYIFLDSLSTSFEYGLFNNGLKYNNSVVFLEDNYSTRERRSVGEYLLKSIPKNNLVTYESYYVNDEARLKEFISFPFDENSNPVIPPPIKERLNNDFIDIKRYVTNGFAISFVKSKEETKNRVNVIYSYNLEQRKIFFKIDVRLAFYLTVMAISNPLIKKMVENNLFEEGFALFKKYIFDTFLESKLIDDNVNVAALVTDNPEIIIEIGKYSESLFVFKHMVFIIERITYLLGKPFKRSITSLRSNLEIVPNFNNVGNFNYINNLLCIRKIDKQLIEDYCSNPDDYLDSRIIKVSGKNRKIIQYKNNHKGRHLRRLHERIATILTQMFCPSEYAFAYKKETSIKMCLLKHIESNNFIKLDVHSFFNSISLKKMCSIFQNRIIATLDKSYLTLIPRKKDISEVLKCCFYKDHLPLGFVTSPIISDIYMNAFDNEIGSVFSKIVFTRYADDILISSKRNLKTISECEKLIVSELNKLGLQLNDDKKLVISLKHIGDSIRFLGINIVKRDGYNELTVSKTNLLEYAKRIHKEKCKKNPDKTVITGILNYVSSVSEKSRSRLEKSYLAMYKETI